MVIRARRNPTGSPAGRIGPARRPAGAPVDCTAQSTAPPASAGFTLVELVVACVVLVVGALGIGSTLSLAMRVLHHAHTNERATQVAGLILDSLAYATTLTDGEGEVDGFRVRWQQGVHDGATLIEVVVEYDDGRVTQDVILTGLRAEQAPARPDRERRP